MRPTCIRPMALSFKCVFEGVPSSMFLKNCAVLERAAVKRRLTLSSVLIRQDCCSDYVMHCSIPAIITTTGPTV